MKIQIMGHDEAVGYRPIGKTGIIRLLDSEALLGNSDVRNEPLRHEDLFTLVFPLVVDDLHSSAEEDYPGSVLFSSKEADYLIQAFHPLSEMDEVIVHCRAGVSRSAAVGILFARYLQRLDLECSIYLNHNIFPNRHILSFQGEMGIEKWDSRHDMVMERLFQQVIEGDHESICQSVKKLGMNWEELLWKPQSNGTTEHHPSWQIRF